MEFEEPIIPKIAPVKKKRQLSEKQKEALKKGREARMKKKKQAEALASPAPAPAPSFQQETLVRHETATSAPSSQQYFTQEQVQDMIYSGVQKYDTERKARKVKKRQSQAKQQHENKVFNDINSQLRVNDPWASAFNF